MACGSVDHRFHDSHNVIGVTVIVTTQRCQSFRIHTSSFPAYSVWHSDGTKINNQQYCPRYSTIGVPEHDILTSPRPSVFNGY